MSEQAAMREELNMMGHEILQYMSTMTNHFLELNRRVNSFAPPAKDPTIG